MRFSLKKYLLVADDLIRLALKKDIKDYEGQIERLRIGVLLIMSLLALSILLNIYQITL